MTASRAGNREFGGCSATTPIRSACPLFQPVPFTAMGTCPRTSPWLPAVRPALRTIAEVLAITASTASPLVPVRARPLDDAKPTRPPARRSSRSRTSPVCAAARGRARAAADCRAFSREPLIFATALVGLLFLAEGRLVGRHAAMDDLRFARPERWSNAISICSRIRRPDSAGQPGKSVRDDPQRCSVRISSLLLNRRLSAPSGWRAGGARHPERPSSDTSSRSSTSTTQALRRELRSR